MLLHRDPIARKWPTLVRIMLSRLVILACLFLGLTALVPRDILAFYAFIALAFVINIPYALWLRNDAAARRSAPLQSLADAVIITGLIHFTGGINSGLCLLYPLLIVSAGILGGGRYAAKITILCTTLYAALVVVELRGILPYLGPAPTPYSEPATVVQQLMIRIFVFVFFSAVSSFLASRLSYQARQIHRYRELVDAIFNHVPVGLFALDNGRVLLANAAGAELLGVPPDDLIGRKMTECFVDRRPDLGEIGSLDGVWQLQRDDGGILPVALELSRVHLPADVSGDTVQTEASAQPVCVLAVRDLSETLRAEQAMEEATRLRTAFRVAAELAHSIRNPLTAIQSAGDSLALLVEDPTPPDGDTPRSPPDAAAVKALHEVLKNEIRELDERIEAFLDSASTDPEELLHLAAERYTDPIPESGQELSKNGKKPHGQ
ncbi:MAG: PAS domain-containing protein [Kiritimatiellaeota bacterium]|nr:PAS domain-containing protein [Kiritimatiellota bacterium]